MSMLKICGQELELDLFDADTMEVFEKAMADVLERVKTVGNDEELSNADGIRKTCGIVKEFFDKVFGEGTADKLFKGKNNLAACMDAFGAVSAESNKMKGQVNAIANKYGINRAQRRHEGKSNKHGKNGTVVTPISNAHGCDNS